jgi:hypothetical protein
MKQTWTYSTGSSSGDEELVLDIDKVGGFHDELAIGVLNRVLRENCTGFILGF